MMNEPKPDQPSIDRQRPTYHFRAEANWQNDPNGLIWWKGYYHMFYQYNPGGAFHANMHWGHAISEDMLHWRHLPITLTPDQDGVDRDGCWSGCAVDNDGVVTMVYTGVRGKDQLTCLATSRDDLLETFEKYPGNPVITAPPPGLELVAYRDHSVWQENGQWWQVVGAGIVGQGGTALLYRSPDLINWEYRGPIMVGDRAETGEMWECPALFKLNGRHVLIVSLWTNHTPAGVSYFSGDFAGEKFTPQTSGSVDNGGTFYAPQTMLDPQGRRLMWGWLMEERSVEVQKASGWSGVMSLPRVLSVLPDGRLAQAPALELLKLRRRHYSLAELAEVRGDCLEILLVLKGSAELAVRRSPDGTEETLIRYDRATNHLVIDRERASLDPELPRDRKEVFCPPSSSGVVKLQIFLDRSVIEVFVNDEVAMACRVYPTRPDSLGLRLEAQAGVKSLDIWELSNAG